MIKNKNLPEKTIVELDKLPRLHKKTAKQLLTMLHLIDGYFEKTIVNGTTVTDEEGDTVFTRDFLLLIFEIGTLETLCKKHCLPTFFPSLREDGREALSSAFLFRSEACRSEAGKKSRAQQIAIDHIINTLSIPAFAYPVRSLRSKEIHDV